MIRNNGKGIGTGRAFITNHLKAVDVPNEWYYDKNTNKLYLQVPTGTHPSELNVEAKSRTYAIHMTNVQGVLLQGIYVKGAGISLLNTSDCQIDYCSVTYPTAMYVHDNEYNWQGTIRIDGGARNKITNSYFAYSWGNMIDERKGEDNLFHNNLIENFNWQGTYNGAIHLGGLRTKVTHNTIRKSGRFLLYGTGIRQGIIKHNELSEGMLLGQDGGAFYTHGALGEQTEISYNWIHNLPGVEQQASRHPIMNMTAGIYLDGGSQNFRIHHNVIWGTTIPINLNAKEQKPSKDNLIYNNTCISNLDISIRSGARAPKNFINIKVYDNLVNKPVKLSPNIYSHNNQVDEAGLIKYRISDSGTSNSGFKALEQKLDAGAYTTETADWQAGADLSKIPSY